MALKRSSSREQLNQSIESQVEEAGLLSKGQGEKLKIRNIRMSDSDWERLKSHFAARGLSVSAGIRFIVKEYLRQHQ
jgi:predicted DNA binding CopG/RHH family protein